MKLPSKPPDASEPLPTTSMKSWERSKADANAQMSVLGIWEKADNLPNPLHKRGLLSLNDALIPIKTKTSEPQIQHSLHQPLHQSGLASLKDALMPAIT